MPVAKSAMEAYLSARQALIDEELSRRLPWSRPTPLTDLERRADEHVARIKKRENETVWSREATGEDVYPGMPWRDSTPMLLLILTLRLI